MHVRACVMLPPCSVLRRYRYLSTMMVTLLASQAVGYPPPVQQQQINARMSACGRRTMATLREVEEEDEKEPRTGGRGEESEARRRDCGAHFELMMACAFTSQTTLMAPA